MNATTVKLPEALWRIMEPRLRAEAAKSAISRRNRIQGDGLPIFVRLKDLSERLVHVNWNGEITAEEYRGMGYRGDAQGAPTFTQDDIESWGYRESKWKPTFIRPLQIVSSWQVLAWADGRTGSAWLLLSNP